jgi:L-lactate dehydrogenase
MGTGGEPLHVSVVGPGNVGAFLLLRLASDPRVTRVSVIGRREESVRAAILDVASAFPEGASKLANGALSEIENSDLVVLAQGSPVRAGEPAHDLRGQNSALTESIVSSRRFKPSAIVIVVTAPVDDITVLVQRLCGLPPQQVLGFGGDLDRNRLHYVLQKRGRRDDSCFVIGEHGPRAIPVYQDLEDYESVAAEVRGFVRTIAAGGPLRNHATGVLLGNLVDTILSNAGSIHSVCGYHTGHGVFLTWPWRVGRTGILGSEPVTLPGPIQRELGRLIALRRP